MPSDYRDKINFDIVVLWHYKTDYCGMYHWMCNILVDKHGLLNCRIALHKLYYQCNSHMCDYKQFRLGECNLNSGTDLLLHYISDYLHNLYCLYIDMNWKFDCRYCSYIHHYNCNYRHFFAEFLQNFLL